MVRIKYKIYTLSARAVLSYAKEINDDVYSILLNSAATEKCRGYSALHEQEDKSGIHVPSRRSDAGFRNQPTPLSRL